jgi:hypothetical protein
MKIAQIAPLAESCPPKLYGGTERIVSYLTEELVRLGHDVTLFARRLDHGLKVGAMFDKSITSRCQGPRHDALLRHDAG